MNTVANTIQMTRKMTAVIEAMMTTVWEFMLTAVLLGGDASVVLGGGKHPAAVDRIVTVTDRLYRHKLYSNYIYTPLQTLPSHFSKYVCVFRFKYIIEMEKKDKIFHLKTQEIPNPFLRKRNSIYIIFGENIP